MVEKGQVVEPEGTWSRVEKGQVVEPEGIIELSDVVVVGTSQRE